VPEAPGAPDARGVPDALIREARRRTRRRRLSAVAAAALLIGIAAGLYALHARAGPGVIAETADTPLANLRAFSGHGELAFVSRDQLWVLDGSGATLRHLRVPAGYTASSPVFSHDGRWLAYVVKSTNENYDGTDQLWIADADGNGAHEVPGVRLTQLVGWSPRADTIALTVGQQLKYPPIQSATAVDLVSPPDRVRTLVRAPADPMSLGGVDAVGGAVWSPAGAALAVALQGGRAAEIETVPISGSVRPTVWFASRDAQAVPVVGMRGRVPDEVIPDLAGWWKGWGVAFWIYDFGGVRNLDSTPLLVIRRAGEQPRLLAQTLSVGLSDEVAAGPYGKLALVASSSAGREYAAGKAVHVCNPTGGGCAPVPEATGWSGPRIGRCRPCTGLPVVPAAGLPGSGVSEDPAWSQNGRLLAYEKAPTDDNGAWPSDGWFADHAIYVWNSVTHATRRVGTIDGSALPTWSGDGEDLMYESSDGLWLMPIATGKPVEIAHPLYSEADWNSKVSHLASISFYGQIPWRDQFSWWSGH
jgi:hypothetical protein